MNLPISSGPFENTTPKSSIRLISMHSGKIILPKHTAGSPKRLAVRIDGDFAWSKVAKAIRNATVGTEQVISIFVQDPKGKVRSIGMPGAMPLTGPIHIANRMPKWLELNITILHGRHGKVRWKNSNLLLKKATKAVSDHGRRKQKWYLPTGQRFTKHILPVWLETEHGTAFQEVVTALSGFQSSKLTGTRVELR